MAKVMDSGSSSSSMDNPIDRLSGLPDSLICQILSSLPTRKVVATSVLSTRWKSLWKIVPSIEFGFPDMYRLESDHGENPDARQKVFQNVNRVIVLRDAKGSLDKFRLDALVHSQVEADYVNIWVSYAIPKNLRSLDLNLSVRRLNHCTCIPETLFKCANLESLKLNGAFILKLPNVFCLPKLEELECKLHLRVTNKFISNLVSSCPVLRSVTITRLGLFDTYSSFDDHTTAVKISSSSLKSLEYVSCEEGYPENVEVDAPKLEFLKFSVAFNECSIKVGQMSSLDKASLTLGWNSYALSREDFLENGMYNYDRCNSTVKLVNTFNNVKCLALEGLILKAISNATIPLSARFERLTLLDISVPCCEWGSVAALLGCCITLQSFSMSTDDTLFVEDACAAHKQCWEDPKKVPQCLLSSLSRVSLKTFRGLRDEMSMVHYFQKHGSVLESFNVTAHSSVSDSDKLQMLRVISKFPRLSSACSVEFV